MLVVQIGQQAGLSRFPAEGLARDEVRGREIERNQVGEEAEVSRQHQHVCGDAHGRQAQTTADSFGDLAEPETFSLNAVPALAGRTLFKCQPE